MKLKEKSIKLISEAIGHNYTIGILTDTVQNYAVYGVNPEDVDNVKESLQVVGDSFKMIKSRQGSYIICFKFNP